MKNKIIELYQANKKKIWAIGISALIFMGLVLGVMVRPTIDRMVDNYNDMTRPMQVTNIPEDSQKTKEKKQIAKEERVIEMYDSMLEAIYNQRHQEKSSREELEFQINSAKAKWHADGIFTDLMYPTTEQLASTTNSSKK